ncbi:hypothetical protein KAW64_17195 [bacterium]|nr:hypothetical protein [bacterium]
MPTLRDLIAERIRAAKADKTVGLSVTYWEVARTALDELGVLDCVPVPKGE